MQLDEISYKLQAWWGFRGDWKKELIWKDFWNNQLTWRSSQLVQWFSPKYRTTGRSKCLSITSYRFQSQSLLNTWSLSFLLSHPLIPPLEATLEINSKKYFRNFLKNLKSEYLLTLTVERERFLLFLATTLRSGNILHKTN